MSGFNESTQEPYDINNMEIIFANENIIESDNNEDDPGIPNNPILIVVPPNDPVPSTSETQNMISNISSEEVISSLKVNDFIQVKFLYNNNTKKSTTKQFVCQVKQITKGIKGLSLLCRFIREYKGSKNAFIFPVIEDLWYVIAENVIKKLQIVSEKRGIYNFNTSLE